MRRPDCRRAIAQTDQEIFGGALHGPVVLAIVDISSGTRLPRHGPDETRSSSPSIPENMRLQTVVAGLGSLGTPRSWIQRRNAFGNFSRSAKSSSTLCISSKVAGSGNVGPLASAHSFPAGTSLTAKVTFVAGPAAAASLPPFTAEKCLRTAFIASMGAPQLTSARMQLLHIRQCKLAIERQLHKRRAASRQKKKHQRPLITLRQHFENRFPSLPALLIRDRVPRDKTAHPLLSIYWNRWSGNYARERNVRRQASLSPSTMACAAFPIATTYILRN